MSHVWRKVRQFAVVTLFTSGALTVGGTPAQAVACPYNPNYYAGGTGQTNGTQWGGRAYISTATNLTFTQTNYHFSDQAVHAIDGATGLEVGWYVGWGAETGTYVTAPHAYATLNGPHEIDGPNVGSSDYMYSTYWNDASTKQIWKVKTVEGGSIVWSGSQNTSDTGPGTIVTMGEVNASSLPMFGVFDGVPNTLEYYNIFDNWIDWTGVSLCADTGFTVSGNRDSITDSGNL